MWAIHQSRVKHTKSIKDLRYKNFDRTHTQQTTKSPDAQITIEQKNLERRNIASFSFRWNSDENTRLIFCITPDVNGRNVQRFGRSVIHYWRWVEAGYLVELMRLTDFMNSLPLHKRQRLSALASLKWLKPCEQLVLDLWDVATDRKLMAQFLRVWEGD